MDTRHEDFHDSAYRQLAGGDDGRWAFGTDFEDPLAGVDTRVPAGVDAQELAAYCLMLGDDALVMSHHLSQWCSHAPDLEEDIALANIALDLLGQARLLLSRAAAADPPVVPRLPADSPVPAEDALAFFRDDSEYVNVRLVEAGNDDFARLIARLVLFSSWRFELLERLATSVDPVVRAVAEKGIKEVSYHRDFSARWLVTLAQGTPESRRRMKSALDAVWRLHDELFITHPVERRLFEQDVAADPQELAGDVESALDRVLSAAELDRPEVAATSGLAGRYGRDGVHTEELSHMLADMQSVARAHPGGRW